MVAARGFDVLDLTPISMMTESAREASDFLKALAHESRLHILCQRVNG